MEYSSISDRLRQLRERSGLSIRALADRVGVPASTYSNYEARYKRPYLPMEFAQALAQAFTGTGITTAEVMALAGVDQPQRVENGLPAPQGSKLVPVFDLAASAGNGAIAEYESIAYSLAFPPEYLTRVTRSHPKNLAIISVKGDSMEPILKDDDIVMVDVSKRNVGYDGMFVLRHFDVIKVKRLRLSPDRQTITLVSNNPNYQPEDWPVEDIEIIGRVIWVGGKV